MSPRVSPHFLLSSHINLKKKIFAQNIYTFNTTSMYTHQILKSNLSGSSQTCPHKVFFLPLFLKSSNFNLKFFYTIAVFDLIRQFVPKIYYSI